MSSVVDGMCQHLAAGVTGWDYANDRALDPDKTPISVGASPSTGGAAVTVTTYPGGPEPDTGNGWEYPRMQVRVRGATALAALDLDRLAFDVLQAARGAYPITLPGGWFLQDCYALQSEAQPLGVDSNGRHEYIRNYQLAVEPPA